MSREPSDADRRAAARVAQTIAKEVYSKNQISEQKRQILECLAEQTDGDGPFTLTFEKQSQDHWEITLTADSKTGRGVGRSIEEAWDNLVDVRM